MPTLNLTDSISLNITSKEQLDILSDFLFKDKYSSISIGYHTISNWYKQYKRAYEYAHHTKTGTTFCPVIINNNPRKIILDSYHIIEQTPAILNQLELPQEEPLGEDLDNFIGQFIAIGWDNTLLMSVENAYIMKIEFTPEKRGPLCPNNISITSVEFDGLTSNTINQVIKYDPVSKNDIKEWTAIFPDTEITLKISFLLNNLLLPYVDTRHFHEVIGD